MFLNTQWIFLHILGIHYDIRILSVYNASHLCVKSSESTFRIYSLSVITVHHSESARSVITFRHKPSGYNRTLKYYILAAVFLFSTTACNFGLGFPHNRCPFCSFQIPCPPSFITVQYGSIHPSIHVNIRLPFSLLLTLPSSNYLTVPLPNTVATFPPNSNLHTLITVTMSGDVILLESCCFIVQEPFNLAATGFI